MRVWPFLFRLFSSLRLTVVLLVLSMALVFFGTLDQVHWGIHETQRRYFESFLAVWHYPSEWPGGGSLSWLRIPLPGGFTLGILLVLNLLAAHFRHFVPSWRKVGIVIIHGGLLMLIVSGFATSAFQKESQMWLQEGGRSNYTTDSKENELVVIDRSGAGEDHVVSVPVELLRTGARVALPDLPFTVHVKAFYPNAAISPKGPMVPGERAGADRGVAGNRDFVVTPQPMTYRDNEVNTATALVTLETQAGPIGTWLVSNVFEGNFPAQTFEHAGREYEIALRFSRHYLPFWLHLKDFTHDVYPGTTVPRNFSSLVTIEHPGREDRQALIYMNHPLRYEGLTFFQASFGNNDTASMLMVVKNPGWLLPYVAVLIVGVGLTVQFSIHLVDYLRRQKAKAPLGGQR